MLMHMGSLAVVGSYKPANLVHIIINNSAHETVGGMPTVVGNINLERIANSCGYGYVRSVDDYDRLDEVLEEAKECEELSLIEVKCGIGSRADLGRPTTTAMENKNAFMDYLKEI